MSLVQWPAGLAASGFQLTLDTNQRVHASPFGGSEQVVDMLNDRWLASLTLRATRRVDGGKAEAFIGSLRGMTNTVNLWHMARPVPLGTMRGTPITIGTHAAGAAILNISTSTAGETLRYGDMIGAGSLLLMVAADCTSDGSGVMAAPLVNRLRVGIAMGSAVIWNRPTAAFRLASRAGVGYTPGVAQSVGLDFVEAIT